MESPDGGCPQGQSDHLMPPAFNPVNATFPTTARSNESHSHQYLPPFNVNLLPGSERPSASVPPDFAAAGTTPQTNPQLAAQEETGPSGTWAGRNPSCPIIPARTHRNLTELDEAEKEAHASAKAMRSERRKALEEAIQAFVEEQNAKVESIAETYSVTKEYVSNLIGTVSSRRPARKPQLQNALIHAKAKEVNTALPSGKRYGLAELRQMVAEDEKMQNLTEEQKQGYIAQLEEARDTKVHGVRANNAAAARDVLLSVDRFARELDALRLRTGVYATLFITRGHINDAVQSTWYATDNSPIFWEDMFKHSLGDICRQYEQWACAQGQSIEERDTLSVMKKQVTAYIANGLKVTTGKSTVAMNYNNYETSIIDTYGVKLVGWPAGIPFGNPSSIGTVGDMRKLRDALRTGACCWKRLSKTEREEFSKELQARHAAGEQVKKPRKKRSDSGSTRKRKASTAGAAGKKRARKDKTRRAKRVEEEEDSGSE